MTRLLFLSLIAAALSAQQPDPLAKIRSLIDNLNAARKNDDARAFAQLFTAGGVMRFEGLAAFTGREAIEKAAAGRRAWSEVTPPMIRDEQVSFVSPDVALVDAVEVQFGSAILKRSTPVLLVLRQEGGEWRVFSMRSHPMVRMSRMDYPSPAE